MYFETSKDLLCTENGAVRIVADLFFLNAHQDSRKLVQKYQNLLVCPILTQIYLLISMSLKVNHLV